MWLLEKIKRVINKIKIDLDKKFIDFVENNDYEVLTPSGWKDFKGVGKTVKYTEYILKTENHELICADKHLVKTEFQFKTIDQLSEDDKIETKSGLESIISVTKTNKSSHMYDLIGVETEEYYTNDILSHNSTVYTIFCAHTAIFYPDKRIGILTKDGALSREILSRVQMAYIQLPMWMQKGAVIWNKGNIKLENDSEIMTAALSEDAFTGFSLNVLIMDEVSKISKTIWKALNESLIPTLSSGKTTKMICVSTPKGDNHFKAMVKGAIQNIKTDGKEGNNFKLIEVPIRDIDLTTRGTTYNKFKSEQIKALGKKGFAQEYDCRFIAMDGTLIDGFVLASLASVNGLEYNPIVEKLSKYKEFISIFKKPDPTRTYTISLDPNEYTVDGVKNKDKQPDGIGIHVVDISSLKDGYEQVATAHFPGGSINYLETDFVLYILGTLYNSAWCFIENNIAGKQIGASLEETYMYENIYYEKQYPGYRLTKGNKGMLCQLLKTLIENKGLKINHQETIEQLKVFMSNGKAFGLDHDDLITSLFGNIYWLFSEEDEVANMFEDTGRIFEVVSKYDVVKKLFILNKNDDSRVAETATIMLTIEDEIDQSDIEDGYYEEDYDDIDYDDGIGY